MAWIAVSKKGQVTMFNYKPVRYADNWICPENVSYDDFRFEELSKGFLRVFLKKKLTWEDEPYEINLVPTKIDVKIEYDGAYPTLCMGHLIVIVNGITYDFGNNSLISGGSCYWADANEPVTKGPWDIDFPEDFPEMYKTAVLEKVNEKIPQGCCGGCL